MPQQEGQITNTELASRLKKQYPQLSGYTDNSVVESFLAKNPGFRSKVSYELAAPAGKTTIGPEPPLSKRIAAQAASWAPAAGGTIGGIAGTTGGPLGAIGGAALGGGAGEALQQLIRRIAGIGHVPTTSGEAAKSIALGGAEQGAYQATGEAIGRYVPWGKMFQGARIAGEDVLPKDIFEMSKTPGIKMSAGEIRGAPKGIMRNISELGMLSEKATQQYQAKTVRSAERLADDFLSSLSSPTSALRSGQDVKQALATAGDAFKKEGGQLFAPFRGQSGQAIALDMRPLSALASTIESQSLGEIPKQSPAGQLLETMKNVGSASGNFDTGMQVREYLRRYLPGPDQMFADRQAEVLAKRFWGTLSNQMDRDAAAAGTNVAQGWREAKQFWATGRNLFDSRVIKGIVKKNPEAVVDSIRPGEITDIRRIKQILTSYGTPAEKAQGEQAWNSFQRAFAEKRILTDPTSRDFTIKDLKGLKGRLDKLGAGQLREVYGNPQGQVFIKNVRTLAELMSRADFQSGIGIGKFRVLYDIMGTLGSAGYGAMTRSPLDAALGFAGVEGTPRLLSAVLHNKTASNMLLRSILSPPSTKANFAAITQRIIATTVKELQESEKETGDSVKP